MPKLTFNFFIGGFNLEILDKDGFSLTNLTQGIQGQNDQMVMLTFQHKEIKRMDSGQLKKDEVFLGICPIVKHIWILSFETSAYCFSIS